MSFDGDQYRVKTPRNERRILHFTPHSLSLSVMSRAIRAPAELRLKARHVSASSDRASAYSAKVSSVGWVKMLEPSRMEPEHIREGLLARDAIHQAGCLPRLHDAGLLIETNYRPVSLHEAHIGVVQMSQEWIAQIWPVDEGAEMVELDSQLVALRCVSLDDY